MRIKYLLAVSGLILLSLSASHAQTQNASCKAIRKVPYPVTQKRADQKLRIALLELCPSNPGMVARPMLPTMENGRITQREYDIVRVFKSAASAKKYAKAHNITDISF